MTWDAMMTCNHMTPYIIIIVISIVLKHLNMFLWQGITILEKKAVTNEAEAKVVEA